jgi:hypothetical protein
VNGSASCGPHWVPIRRQLSLETISGSATDIRSEAVKVLEWLGLGPHGHGHHEHNHLSRLASRRASSSGWNDLGATLEVALTRHSVPLMQPFGAAQLIKFINDMSA